MLKPSQESFDTSSALVNMESSLSQTLLRDWIAGATQTLLDYGDMKTIRILLASNPELDSPSLSSTAPSFGLANYTLTSL